MDQNLKQRLVGIIVITAIAAIFVPMMFDDPVEKSGRTVSNLKIPKLPKEEIFDSRQPEAPQSPDQVTRSDEAVKDSETSWMTPVIKNAVEQISKPERQSATEKTPQMLRWVIQVGSFGEEKNALSLRDDLRSKGFPAFVEKFDSMFRVRIGPELDQKRAEQIKQKLERETQLKSILVSE